MAYTEQERAGFVERMWAEGLSPSAAERLWGFPTRKALAKWAALAEAGALPARRPPAHPKGCPGHRKHAAWPRETKDEALRLSSAGRKPSEVAAILGLPSGRVVSQWKRAARRGAAGAGCAKVSPEGRAQGAPAAREGAPSLGVSPGDLERLESMGADELRGELLAALGRLDVLTAMVLDPKAGGPASLPNRQKAALGERLRGAYGLPLKAVTSLLRISKSTYEYNRARLDAPAARDADISGLVLELFESSSRTWGYRRVHAAMRARGVVCSEKRVRRAMAAMGLAPAHLRRAKGYSSYAGEPDAGAPNRLLDRRGRHVFRAAEPGLLWLTDVTEFSVPAGRLYLSPVVDCFDGAVVAWSLSEHPDAALADSMLAAALGALDRSLPGPVVHSDRGGLYRRAAWRGALAAAGCAQSMSRKGRSPDNAAMEGFFGRMKNEMFHGRDWTLATLGELRCAIEGYMRSYNSGRLKSFREGGRTVYDTINGRRARLGLAPAA